MDAGIAYLNGVMIQATVGMVMIIVFAAVFLVIVSKRKSQYYRKYIADMYVAAKIKFFAKEDNLDLVAEQKTFKRWLKKQSEEYRDVDESVAQELKERIAGSRDKTIKEE